MNVLLTSTGISTRENKIFFSQKFAEFVGKRVAFIYTMRQPDDIKWLPHYEDELRELQLDFEGINISEERDLSQLSEFDGYYVGGGNTFYILERLKSTWLFQLLVDEIKRGKLYVWVSAGSIIFWSDIQIAGWWVNGDENDIGLEDLSGMNFISSHIAPHYSDANEQEILLFEELRKAKVVRLRDDEMLLVDNNNLMLI